ncbi:MAG: serine hydrolase [Actinomycetota bacterium]|nr:serine hydrolase [Actinomycetota bacterium]
MSPGRHAAIAATFLLALPAPGTAAAQDANAPPSGEERSRNVVVASTAPSSGEERSRNVVVASTAPLSGEERSRNVVVASTAPPNLPSAAAAILIDARDGSVILQKNPDQRRSIASTTKLMTALLTLEEAEPADVFRAAAYDALPIESKIDLRTGERMRVDDLLEALLLESANDAAATLAEGVSGSRPAFVEDMNARARDLGLEDTGYANPIGLDDSANYSTARDLASLARRLLRNRRFARTVDLPAAELESGDRPRVVNNRNNLVAAYDFVDGVKTGYTGSAGYVLVGAASGRLGSKVVSVVLGEPSEAARDMDTLALLRYGLAQFRRVKALDSNRPAASADVEHRDETAKLVPARDLLLVKRRGQKVTTRVDAPDTVEGELAAGERVGSIAVLRDGRLVGRVALVTAAEVPGAGPLRVVADVLGTGTLVLLLALGAGAGTFVLASRARTRRTHDAERAARRRAR